MGCGKPAQGEENIHWFQWGEGNRRRKGGLNHPMVPEPKKGKKMVRT